MSDVSESQYKSIRARVYRWAFRLLQNEHDALDATQNVLLKALRVPPAELERRTAWLRRITINHCIDDFRRRRPTAPLVDAADDSEWGIQPDQVIELSEEEIEAVWKSWQDSGVIQNDASGGTQQSILIDRQLQRALEILRDSS